MYSLEKLVWGYCIKAPNPHGKYYIYVSKVHRNGKYEFTTDYTYAKFMSRKTAEKHLSILNGG